MSALLRQAHSNSNSSSGSSEAPLPIPSRSRVDSTQGLGDEDPQQSAMAKSLFVNAIKAIRQGQPELLDLFLKKHPEIAIAKGPVEREGGTKVNSNTGQQETYPAVTLEMSLLELTVLQGPQASKMSISILERMPPGQGLVETLGALYDGEMSALGGMVRSGQLDVLKQTIEMVKDGKLTDVEAGEMLTSVLDGKGSDLPFGACATGQLPTLQYLVGTLGMGVNHASPVHGATCLHVAAAQATYEVTDYLISQGAAVDAVDKDSVTPLILASKSNNIKVMQSLHAAGASLSIRNAFNADSLYVASQLGRVEAVKLLLEWGADPSDTSCGREPADDEGNPEQPGVSPVHIASMMGHASVLELLLSHLPTLPPGGPHALSPLHYAAQQGNVKCCELILSHGVPPTVKGGNGATPLHLAAWHGKREAVDLLLASGHPPSTTDAHGKTPADYAEEASKLGYEGAKKVMKLLRGEKKGKKKKKASKGKGGDENAGKEGGERKKGGGLERMG